MRCDVFLSFSEEFIRKTFLSHLLRSLDRKGITAVTSAPNNPNNNQAIRQSVVAISVISKNYIYLDLWVDELAKIIKYVKKNNSTAVPVFLQVDPGDVFRALTHAGDSTGLRIKNLVEVSQWLHDHLAHDSGFDSRDCEDDSELVDKITNFVSDTLISAQKSSRSSVLKWAVPKLPRKKNEFGRHSKLYKDSDQALEYEDTLRMKTVASHSKPFESRGSPKPRAEEVREMLFSYSRNRVHTIGIYGMEGVGKTALARHVYDEISPLFQHHIFMNNLSKQDSSSSAPSLLEIFSTKASFHGSSDVTKQMVGQRKVLVVADSVDDIKQLQSFLKEVSLFGPGSRVMVITQDKSLLVQCGVKHMYEVARPEYEEAIQIFSHFAFKQTKPVSGFEELTCRAVEVAGRIPLALKVLGSFLYGMSKYEWENALHKFEASYENYISGIRRYVGGDDFTSRGPIIPEPHIGADEANRFPLYCFTFN